MRALRCGFIAIVAALLSAFAAWMACEMFHSHTSNPSGRAATYAEYRAHMPQPIGAQIFQKDGIEYFVAFGPVRPPLATPSGSPAYVFDRSGRMIDWTLDMGDDWRFQKSWTGTIQRRIPVSDLDEILSTPKA